MPDTALVVICLQLCSYIVVDFLPQHQSRSECAPIVEAEAGCSTTTRNGAMASSQGQVGPVETQQLSIYRKLDSLVRSSIMIFQFDE